MYPDRPLGADTNEEEDEDSSDPSEAVVSAD